VDRLARVGTGAGEIHRAVGIGIGAFAPTRTVDRRGAVRAVQTRKGCRAGHFFWRTQWISRWTGSAIA
jgi:hypothetical protein